MYHSLIFWDGCNFYNTNDAKQLKDPAIKGLPKGIHTWHDLKLIPAAKPSIALPPVVSQYVEIYGRAGSTDLTEKFTNGEIVYGDRTGTIQFYIYHDLIDWRDVRKKIVTALEGKTVKMVLEDDPEYYYEGEFSITGITPGASYSQLTLSYELGPFRYWISDNQTLGHVIWDTFNFETDYDRSTIDTIKEGVL